MKVLLINPNRVLFPPVPPIGLEYLSASLVKAGHEIKLLDLTFHKGTESLIDEAVSEFMPDIAGVTIRNIDSVLFNNNVFYLDSIRDIINCLRTKHCLKVIIGGAGILISPEGVLRYLGADYVIAGPAESAINDLLRELEGEKEVIKQVWKGVYRHNSPCGRSTALIDYQKYYDSGALAGFETHKGCSSSCVYCIEANTPVSFKRPEIIIQEIRGFVAKGHSDFHLCDAEFNEDLDHAIEFCKALRQERMHMRWAVYMKPANYNQRLFRLMKETGVYLITLSIDSFRKCPLYWTDTEKIVFNAKANGIRIVIDFLTGFPYESGELLQWCLDFFRRLHPDRVNINTFIRLYKPLLITKIIAQDLELSANILGNRDNTEMIEPIFFNRIDTAWLRECISSDTIFKIEGQEKGVNYSRT